MQPSTNQTFLKKKKKLPFYSLEVKVILFRSHGRQYALNLQSYLTGLSLFPSTLATFLLETNDLSRKPSNLTLPHRIMYLEMIIL